LLDKYNMGEQSTDFVYLADQLPSFSFPGNLKQLYNYSVWKKLENKSNCHPLFRLEEYLRADEKDHYLNLVSISAFDLDSEEFGRIPFDHTLVFVLETHSGCGMQDQRQAFFRFLKAGIETPVIIKRTYTEELTSDQFQLYAATDVGGLFVDGCGDGMGLDAPQITPKTILSTSFRLLQATRSRI